MFQNVLIVNKAYNVSHQDNSCTSIAFSFELIKYWEPPWLQIGIIIFTKGNLPNLYAAFTICVLILNSCLFPQKDYERNSFAHDKTHTGHFRIYIHPTLAIQIIIW